MGKPMRGSSLDAEASPGTLLLPEGGNTRAAPPCSGRLVLNFALVLLPTLAFGCVCPLSELLLRRPRAERGGGAARR